MPTSEPYIQVADDVYQVRIPLPFALNIVNCYLLRGDGWTVVDTGINTPAGQAAWRAAFNALGIRPADIRQIVLTHVHPDHYGLAGWLQGLARAEGTLPPVRMSAREAEIAQVTWGRGGRAEMFVDFLMACGMPAEMVGPVARGIAGTREMTLPHPQLVETVQAGDVLTMGRRRFKAIHAPGHSDGQLLFYDQADRLILSGDQVLMKITPNIGLWPDTEADPLARFLTSLCDLKSLNVRLALPGHKAVITDWQGRLGELERHHAARLEHTLAACKDGATVYEASLKVFDSNQFSTHEWRFAMVETLAHIEYLRLRGRITREGGAAPRYRST